MKKVLVLLIFTCCLIACSNKKQVINDKITARQLLKIIDDSSFVSFKKLADSAGYSVADSTVEPDGGILYITTQPGDIGNTFGVTMSKDFHIELLHFSTDDKGYYKRLKEQIVKIGFRSLGKESNPESEEFEMFNIFIGTATLPGDAHPNTYEVTLYRKN